MHGENNMLDTVSLYTSTTQPKKRNTNTINTHAFKNIKCFVISTQQVNMINVLENILFYFQNSEAKC